MPGSPPLLLLLLLLALLLLLLLLLLALLLLLLDPPIPPVPPMPPAPASPLLDEELEALDELDDPTPPLTGRGCSSSSPHPTNTALVSAAQSKTIPNFFIVFSMDAWTNQAVTARAREASVANGAYHRLAHAHVRGVRVVRARGFPLRDAWSYDEWALSQFAPALGAPPVQLSADLLSCVASYA